MSVEDISPEELARTFFHYHEALGAEVESSGAPQHQTWNDIPCSEKQRMIAAARLALLEIAHSKDPTALENNPYFPTPGSAEWGC